ncbi:MAG: polysaccharide biosynthesis C-terminal domain-containing protein [Crocinitomicaceae bacterium]|nr:polysaccharide biosynthesis C-terminal domain-containing protein [Crocinitomicaceae bacterium]
MKKKFFTNLVLVLILNVLVKPFYILGIDAEILKQVESHSPGQYGEYFSILGFTFILNVFLDLGITNYNTRNIARNKQSIQEQFSGIITLRGLLSVGYMFLILISGYFLGYNEHQFKLLGYLAFNQILVAFILYFRSNLSGLLLFKQDSIISILDRFLLIIICTTLLWGGVSNEPFQIEWFVWAQTAAYGITALIAACFVLQKTGKVKMSFNWKFSKEVIQKSLPYALLILLMTIYYRSDSVMLERMLPDGAKEAAIYARGYRFFEALNMVGYLFAGLLLPIFSRLLKQKESVHELLYFSFKLILSYSIVLGLGAFFYREQIMGWRFDLTGPELFKAARTFGLLMLCFITFTSTYIFGTLLTANGNLKSLNILAAGGVILNLILNYILIPSQGAVGAAVASLITQVISLLIQLVITFIALKINVDYKEFIRIGIFSSCIIVLGYFSTQLSVHWSIQFITALSAGGFISLLSGMISVKGIIQLLQSEK